MSPDYLLVVDADIARAAGPEPKDRKWSESSKTSHDVLDAIRRNHGYRVVFDRNLKNEWEKHAGETAGRWLADMLSSGRVERVDGIETRWVVNLIAEKLPECDHDVAEKDCHLVALAVGPGDDRVLSNDRRAREKFARLRHERIGRIHWIAASDECVSWLSEGAGDRPEWTLDGGQ